LEAPYKAGTSYGILKNSNGYEEKEVSSYNLKTNKGEIKIELNNANKYSVNLWLNNFKKFEDVTLKWAGIESLAFGSVPTDIEFTRESLSFEKFDVLLAAGGYDSNSTQLVFIKEGHTGEYGHSFEGPFARVVGGKNIISKISKGDKILKIEPVLKWEDQGEVIFTPDLSKTLENGDNLFTFVNVEMSPNSPLGAKHFYTLIKGGDLKVDLTAGAYICDTTLHGEECTYENFEPRTEGAVFVRTVGYGTGKVFISKVNMPATLMHSVVGNVTSGIELVKMASIGHTLTVFANPQQIMLQGKYIHEIKKLLSESEIELEIVGSKDDNSLVVSQDPETTLDILKEKKVKVVSIPETNLVKVKLYYDNAPKTVDYFKSSIGLHFNLVGSLKVSMAYDTTYLFEPQKNMKLVKEIFPENTPSSKVNKGDIGITNQASKRMGTIGIKTENDNLFGPTGEKFGNTNVVGKVLEPEKLKHLKKGDLMYIIEAEEGD